jgi:hypothetical protein
MYTYKNYFSTFRKKLLLYEDTLEIRIMYDVYLVNFRKCYYLNGKRREVEATSNKK